VEGSRLTAQGARQKAGKLQSWEAGRLGREKAHGAGRKANGGRDKAKGIRIKVKGKRSKEKSLRVLTLLISVYP
jgi:hypothetical protein